MLFKLAMNNSLMSYKIPQYPIYSGIKYFLILHVVFIEKISYIFNT